ncbi:MAG TPA: DUF1326 domain-containing protein [Dehalococcoidia bacterium]|nr:DUF1326 domain-containing protein [Dehalococcoidia bacterium]
MAQKVKWAIKGDALGSCSCDWGCPCNFDAPPTNGWCHGGYAFHINDGSFGDVSLDGLTVGFFANSPAALHLGNVTGYLLVDEKATDDQRAALAKIVGGQGGGPFAVFASLLVKVIGPDFVPVDFKFDGSNSYAVFGDRVELRLEMIKNPVTGEESGFTLNMTAGLLTDKAELMKSKTFRVSHSEMSYDHSGQYGETFKFNYSGEAQ